MRSRNNSGHCRKSLARDGDSAGGREGGAITVMATTLGGVTDTPGSYPQARRELLVLSAPADTLTG
ncbi:hypothetical protein GCM10009751_32140 [Myceligenerans crystallogenes]|uniref:Uncharacterized protein n=1 Tax=Myceligenerans crystallogenes TaxID=316335 RepID=A0ABN2NID9_9MICO